MRTAALEAVTKGGGWGVVIGETATGGTAEPTIRPSLGRPRGGSGDAVTR